MSRVNTDFTRFAEEGYVLSSLPDPSGVNLIRDSFEDFLKEKLNAELRLEDYHKFIQDNDKHEDYHDSLLQIILDNHWHHALFKNNLSFFQKLVGNDIEIQAEAHLRIVRPGCPQDCIGYHTDIYYGASAFEISCSFSLVDIDKEAALNVVPNSHLNKISSTFSVESSGISKGSRRHKLGFPYAPKKIIGEGNLNFLPIAMRKGDVLCFNLAVVHGQNESLSDITRWSIDCRIRNAFTPLNKNLQKGYYVPFSKSQLTRSAEAFYEKNQDEAAHLVHPSVYRF